MCSEHAIDYLSFFYSDLETILLFFFFFFFIIFFFIRYLFLNREAQRDQTLIDSRIDIMKNWSPPEIGSEALQGSCQSGAQEF